MRKDNEARKNMKMPSSRLNWFIFIASTSVLFDKTFVNSLVVSSGNPSGIEDGDVEAGEQTVYACSGSTLVLQCGENKISEQYKKDNLKPYLDETPEIKSYVIKVTRANYGRFSIALCNEEGRTDWSVNCYEPKTKNIITERCNNKNYCEISSSDYNFGRDPCPDTERYLEAHYVCVQKQSYITTDKPLPAWMNYDNQKNKQSLVDLNIKRKPISIRVPITAPPTRATSVALETEATSAFVTTNKPITPNSLDKESVVSAPVFYENHSNTKIKYKNNKSNENTSFTSANNKNVHILNASNLEKTITANQEQSSALRRCFKTNARGLMWRETHYGAKPSQQCPNNPTSFAQWHCTEKNGKGIWANNWPDLSRCRSKWIVVLMKTEDVLLIQHGREILAMTDKVYDSLSKNPQELFGGDLPPILNLIESHLKSLRIGIENNSKKVSSSHIYRGILESDLNSSIEKLSSILSSIIDVRSIDAWKDLVGNKNSHKATVEQFMDVSENLGAVISLMMTGSEKGSFRDRKKDLVDKGEEIIKEGEKLSSFLEKGNKFAISTSRIENNLATKISTSNLCMYVWRFEHKKTEMFDTISLNQGAHKLNSLRSADFDTPYERKPNRNRNIKINQKRQDQSTQIRFLNLVIQFPSIGQHNIFRNQKNIFDSKRHSVYSSKNSQFLDSSQNLYASNILTQNGNTEENFLSLGIKISLSETSSTSTAKTKEYLGKTNLSSLIFVALRHREPVFQSFESQNEDSNVIYGPLVLLIKTERNGMVLNDENKRIRVEIDFPTSKTQHQSFQKQMKMENMRKVFTKNIVGNATYDNSAYHHRDTCVIWDAWLKTFRKDSKVCQTLSINVTHTKCICTKMGRFGLVNDDLGGSKNVINYAFNGEPINNGKDGLFGDDNNDDKNEGLATTKEGNQVTNNVPWLDNEIEYKDSTSFMIIIIAISSSVLVVTLLGVGFLVFYCKRIKIRDKKWEEAQTHPWYRKAKNNDPDYNERLVTASLSTNENSLQQHLGRGNNSSKIMSGTQLEKHLNDHDSSSSGNYVSTLARHPKLCSVDKISDFPQNSHSMSTSNTTTTLGLSAISNESTTPIGGNNPTIHSIHSCTSSTSSSNHHYQSMEDDRLSFERREAKDGNKKIYNQQEKPNYDIHCSYQYQNHYEQPNTDSRTLINTAQTLNGTTRNNNSFYQCRQQTMPYLTASSQLLPEHLRNRPDNMQQQHSMLTSSDARNQNRIKNIKMHPRTNDDSNDKTRTRWGWLLTRLRKSSPNSQSSSGTSSTSTSLSSATHSHLAAAHHNSHFQHNKNHYNNQANNDLFMYHQQEITAPVSSLVVGQFPHSIDQTRLPNKDISNFASTLLKDSVNLRPNNLPPTSFILNTTKFPYNDRQHDECPPPVRLSKSIETGLKVETNRRSRYTSEHNYHKSQELSYNSDGTFIFPTNHPSPLNGLNRVPENNIEHIFNDNGRMYDYSHDVNIHQEEERNNRKVWLQKNHNPHETTTDNYNVLPNLYQHEFPHSNMVEGYSDNNIERSGLSNSSESSGDLRNEVTLKEDHGHAPEATEKYFSSKPKCNKRGKYDEEVRKTGNRNHGTEDIGNAAQSFEVQERNEFLAEQNINRGKRHSTPRNRTADIAKLAYKVSSNQNIDIFEGLQEDRPKHKLKRANRSNSDNPRNNSDISKKSAKDFAILPNVTNARRDKCFDSSRSNDVKLQNATDILKDTYDMPLDVSKSVPQKTNFKILGTSHDKGCEQQFVNEGNDKEFIHLQQLWLLNGNTLPPGKSDREVKQDICENFNVNSDASIDSFEHEHQNNIYMEVESSKQLKSNLSTKP